MTTTPASAAAPKAPETGARLTTLDPGAGYVTIINTYAVAPERVETLLDLLVRATVETLRHLPGFVSANFHVNGDRTQLVNYAQWRSPEAIAAARNDLPSLRSSARPPRSRIVSRQFITSCDSAWQARAHDWPKRSCERF